MYNGGFLLCSTELCCHPGSALLTLQHPALGKTEALNQKLASTEPETHQGIHDTISEEPVPAYKLSVEWDQEAQPAFMETTHVWDRSSEG